VRGTQKTLEIIIGFLIAVGFGFVVWTGSYDFTDPVEMKAYDIRAKMGASGERNPNIELVVIEENDLSAVKHRDVLASGIENLALAGAKVIALDVFLIGPEESEGLKAVRRLKESYEGAGLVQEGSAQIFYDELSQAVTELDHDSELRQAFERAGNVALPTLFRTRGKEPDQQSPEILQEYALTQVHGSTRTGGASAGTGMDRMIPTLPFLAEEAGAIGHINYFPDADGTVRGISHVFCYGKETCIPSLALAIAMQYRGLGNEDITADQGGEIRWREPSSPAVTVPVVAPGMQTLVRWNQGPDVVFRRTPFSKVLKNEVETSLFRDKVVIIGGGALAKSRGFRTPIAENMEEMEVLANGVANLLDQSFMKRPQWTFVAEFAVLILFGLVLVVVLPGMRAGSAALTSVLLIMAYGAVASLLFVYWNVWIKIAPPILLLAVGCAVLLVKRSIVEKRAAGLGESES